MRWYRDDCPKIATVFGYLVYPEMTEHELRQVSRFDMLAGGLYFGDTKASRQKTIDNIKRLHEYNPRIIVLHYNAGVIEAVPNNSYFTPDCFLKDTLGEVIHGWPGTHMLNLAKPKVQESMAKWIIDSYQGSGADGMFIDCLAGIFDSWSMIPGAKEKGRAILPDADEDGKEDSMSILTRQWTDGKRNIIEIIRNELGNEPYMLVNSGMEHEFLKPYADGNFFEYIWDHITVPNGFGRFDFKRILDDCILWGTTPTGRPNCSYISYSPLFDIDYYTYKRPAAETSRVYMRGFESLRIMRFGLAMSLLTDIHCSMQLHTRDHGQLWWYQEYDLPIGKPLGAAYEHEDGSWRRDYENAVVVANLNYHEIQPHFERRMRDGTTALSSRDFDLPAQDGRIYMRLG